MLLYFSDFDKHSTEAYEAMARYTIELVEAEQSNLLDAEEADEIGEEMR